MNVLFAALSAKNIHKPLAPWCLKAYCETADPNADIRIGEYTVNEPLSGILEDIYLQRPDVAAFSCYIWNRSQIQKAVRLLKQYLPQCLILLGGPEVSFESDLQGFPQADYIITGPGEETMAALLSDLADGKAPEKGIYQGVQGHFDRYPSPFTEHYFASFAQGKMGSIKNQLVYYESSRGCPFSCSYCLSSVTDGVQFLPLKRVYAELSLLVSQGAACIKFVDRTFNANKARAKQILAFIRKLQTDCTFHFEAAADLFDADMLSLIQSMPTGRVQFEIGIQSTNTNTLEAILRKTDLDRVFDAVTSLVSFQNCHVHVDLIAGLPHDTIETFAEAVNRCYAARPHMLQLGFLKLLKGSELRRQADASDYLYDADPPYQVIQSPDMSIDDLIRLKDIETVVDKYYNSGMYTNSLDYAVQLYDSAFACFSDLAGFCKGENLKRTLQRSYELLYQFLLIRGTPEEAAHVIKLDCYLHDPKGMLPARIPAMRLPEAERIWRTQTGNKRARIRAAYFPFDQTARLFCYDKKHPITKKCHMEFAAYSAEDHKY